MHSHLIPWLLLQRMMHRLSIVLVRLFGIVGLVAVTIVDGSGGSRSFVVLGFFWYL